MKIEKVNLGALIHQKVKEKGWSDAKFAKAIGLHRQNVKKTIFDKESLDTNMLCIISELLECNLFNYFKSNTINDCKELKATVTIEMGEQKTEKTFTVCVEKNKVEIK